MAQQSDNIISEHPIQTFANQIPGNAALPLYEAVQSSPSIGNLEDLPEDVFYAIEHIKRAETIYEKASLAHNFANQHIKPEGQFTGDVIDKLSFVALANNPKGDCDNFVSFKRDLLLLGGVPPEDILFTGGFVSYDITQNDTENKEMSGGHAFLIVKDADQYLLLDNNLRDIPILYPKNPTTVQSSMHTPQDMMGFSTADVKIEYISMIQDGTGNGFVSPEATKMMVDHMIDAGHIKKEDLPHYDKLKDMTDDFNNQAPLAVESNMPEPSVAPPPANFINHSQIS